jgi:serpin B
MKKHPFAILTILLLLLACNPLDDPGIDFNCDDNPAVCELAGSSNAFGWDIFRKLHEAEPDSNLFISPFSISTAFGMLLNGARTETREEILQVMYLNGWTEEDINDAFKALLEVLPALDPGVKMNLANSIWYREGFAVLEEFLQKNEEHFQSEVRAMDFNDPATKDIINGWIEDQTNGKIKDMIDQISPQTVMFLINAIYFYGQWQYEFDPEETAQEFFYPDDGEHTTADMMNMGKVILPYYQDPELQMVDLPYGDSIFSMTIMVPNGNNSVDQLIKDLDRERVDVLLGAMEPVELSSLAIPKFKIEYKTTLVKTLGDLGMNRVFDPYGADLSGINGTGGLYVSNVIHQSFIEVDEKGTEAAAATVIVIDYNSVGYSFAANRSFVFLIRDNRTNSVLFVGKVMNP